MSLIRYTHPMLHLQQQLNRMFDQFDTDLFGGLEELEDGVFAPPVDVREDDENYTVHLEVPGVRQENLQLSLQDNVLTIRGTKEQQQQTEGRYRRIERSYGTFVRSLSLPRNVDGEGVTANLQDGVLEVRLPKRAEARSRQIAVSTTVSSQPIADTAPTNTALAEGGETGSETETAPAINETNEAAAARPE